jgi:c-di-GMP-binding flagellar brake protein YcgR
MADSSNFVERRAHERFKVKDGIVAIPHAASTRFGRIRDISLGGLTVRYFDEEELHGKTFEIDLVMTDGNLSLDRVLINIKFDMENSTETPFCILPERRCGLQFVDLTDHQFAKLRNFVDQQAAIHDMIELERPLFSPHYMAG